MCFPADRDTKPMEAAALHTRRRLHENDKMTVSLFSQVRMSLPPRARSTHTFLRCVPHLSSIVVVGCRLAQCSLLAASLVFPAEWRMVQSEPTVSFLPLLPSLQGSRLDFRCGHLVLDSLRLLPTWARTLPVLLPWMVPRVLSITMPGLRDTPKT
jgi:hypothetical protein